MSPALTVFVSMGTCAGGLFWLASTKNLGAASWMGWLLGTCSLACGVTLMLLAVGA